MQRPTPLFPVPDIAPDIARALDRDHPELIARASRVFRATIPHVLAGAATFVAAVVTVAAAITSGWSVDVAGTVLLVILLLSAGTRTITRAHIADALLAFRELHAITSRDYGAEVTRVTSGGAHVRVNATA